MAMIPRGWLVLALTCVVLVASVVVLTVMESAEGAPETRLLGIGLSGRASVLCRAHSPASGNRIA